MIAKSFREFPFQVATVQVSYFRLMVIMRAVSRILRLFAFRHIQAITKMGKEVDSFVGCKNQAMDDDIIEIFLLTDKSDSQLLEFMGNITQLRN